MRSRVGRARTLSIAAAIGAGSAGSAAGAAYKLLIEQSKSARVVIGPTSTLPPRADGVYHPSGGQPAPHGDGTELTLLLLGDSTAAGLGCELVEELPGVLLARGLAEETDRAVHLLTHAVVGANSRALADQVELALHDTDLGEREGGPRPPDAVVIIIGANDVSGKLSPRTAAQLLGAAVARLRGLGCAVVVATCPDLGAIRPIPQPLRSVVRSWSLRLAQEQRHAVLAAGGHPVAVADLLSPEFLTRPEALFSADQFHPSAAGYEAATSLLLPALCFELGVWGGGPLAEPPRRSATAEAHRPTVRATAAVNQALQHRARAGGRAAARLLRLGDRHREK
ncbi:MAG: SGNH/GDSL hydrolase family protein [Mycobacteriaceae bacterium]